MGVFKEHAHAFEAVASKQKQIWNDACDYGYPYNTANVPAEITQLIHFVNDLKGTTFQRNTFKWTGGKTIIFRIGWEIDDGIESGTQYTISYQSLTQRMQNYPGFLCKGCDAFIAVSIENYKELYKAEFNENKN